MRSCAYIYMCIYIYIYIYEVNQKVPSGFSINMLWKKNKLTNDYLRNSLRIVSSTNTD